MGIRHVFGDKPIPRLLDFFLVHRFWDYPISSLSESTGISYRTLQRVIPLLVRNHILLPTRTMGNAKFFALNLESEAVRRLDAFALQVDLEFGAPHRAKAPAHAWTVNANGRRLPEPLNEDFLSSRRA